MRTWTERAEGPIGLRAPLPLVLAVLAVLTGLVAMHGLGPGALPSAAGSSAPAHSAAAGHGTPAAAVPADPCACVHADGSEVHRTDGPDGPGGHAEHADDTCAAPGTSGSPVLSAPAAAPGPVTAAPTAAHGLLDGATACGRAPPSLSELQLLRV
ncbi:DUF6153 family protein [Streptomyces sp. NPDC006512]|uniref:DUF6153 family protein n=1 Tax=Streptomyces sp. NPDC006512 TaxID=3154307 RepID=UPI0033AA9D87